MVAKLVSSQVKSFTIESPHPYADNQDILESIEVVGAFNLSITFDKQTKTERGCDYVTIFKPKSRSEEEEGERTWFGEEKYTGGMNGSSRNFPGVDNNEPLEIPGNRFDLHFHSDSSQNDWGYKIVVDVDCREDAPGDWESKKEIFDILLKTNPNCK